VSIKDRDMAANAVKAVSGVRLDPRGAVVSFWLSRSSRNYAFHVADSWLALLSTTLGRPLQSLRIHLVYTHWDASSSGPI